MATRSDRTSRRKPAGPLIPILFALATLGVFLALGTWQLQRKTWKEALIGTLEERLAADPTDLPDQSRWSELEQSRDEFRRVKFPASFVPGEEALVYATASGLRGDVAGPGYWVFALAHTQRGAALVVNRGFIPEARRDPATRRAGEITGPVTLIGVLRWPQPRNFFTPADQPKRNLWFVRDHTSMAAPKGWGEVGPFFVELEGPQPPGELPHAAPLTPTLRNEHLQYALTWYGLALVVAFMLGFWLHERRRERLVGCL